MKTTGCFLPEVLNRQVILTLVMTKLQVITAIFPVLID